MPSIRSAILLIALASSAHAQQQWTQAVNAGGQAPILQRTIDIDLHDAPLKNVLRVISDQTDGQLIYDGTVTAIGKRITIEARTATVDAVLREVLAGTSVKIFVSNSGQLILLKRVDGRAQTGTIRGVVTDAATQEPLADAQVSLATTTRVAQTSTQGRYTLTNVPAGAVIVRVQRVGYSVAEQAVTVAEDRTVDADFAMHRAAVSLDQIVVTAAGDETRRAQGNSMSEVNLDDIKTAPVNNPQDALDARVPGLTVLQNGGQPGGGGTIRLRGVNSITSDNTPLIYVDGVRIYSALVPGGPPGPGYGGNQGYLPLNDINADDIDHIDVVKGSAATTLYGTEAASGVIQIFTKHGNASRTVWSGEVTAGINNVGKLGPSDDPTDMFMNCRGPGLISSDSVRFVDPSCPSSGTWRQTGDVTRYSASVRGGSDKMNYYVSGNYADEFGVIQTSHNLNGGFRANFAFHPNDHFDFAVTGSFVKRKTRWGPDGDNSQGLLLNVSRGPAGNLVGGNGTTDCIGVPSDETCVVNKYVFESQNYSYVDHFIAGATIDYRASKAVTQRFTLGYDFNANNHTTGVPWGYPGDEPGELYNDQRQHYKVTAEYAGTWTTAVGHHLTSAFSWGGQAYRDVDQWSESYGTNFSGPGTPIITNAGVQLFTGDSNPAIVNAGGFVQEIVGLNDALFVTGGIRVDGNSSFGGHYGLQPYPKVAVAYSLSSLHAWPRWWETMKLRAAYGESGKSPNPFYKNQTYISVPAESGKAGLIPGQIGNANLGPERTTEFEGGFDASALAGRLGLEFTVYRDRTQNALLALTPIPSTGFQNTVTSNVGELENEGIEGHLTGGLVRMRNFDWDARLNMSWLRSRAIDLHGQTISLGTHAEAEVGYPLPTYFAYPILNANAHAEPVEGPESNKPAGAQYPDRLFGAGTTITLFRHVSLDALFEANYGGHLLSYTAYRNELRRTWKPCYAIQQAEDNAAAGDAAAVAPYTAFQRAQCSLDGQIADPSFWIEKTDFIKLRSVSLTYDIPRQWLGRTMSAASLSLQGRNLWTWTKYNGGTDPEVNDVADNGAGSLGRYDYYNFPPYRTWLITARVTF